MYSLPDANSLKWENIKPPEIIAGSQVCHISFDVPKILAFAIWTICSQIGVFPLKYWSLSSLCHI